MANLEAKYTLFESVKQMLASDTLSNLLSRPVTRVEVQPMEHVGVAGSQLSHVDTDAGRFILKQMSMESDYLMVVTHDHQCRAVTLWQYGLLDQLDPHTSHGIIACAREKNDWAMMMADFSNNLFHQEKNPFSPNHVPSLLDTLARQHAAFWNKPDLHDAQLGLCRAVDLIYACSPTAAKKYDQQGLGLLPEALRTGWESLEGLLDGDAFGQMLELVENPTPLLKAIEHLPVTLVHGDYRPENLAFTDHYIVLDWQLAACSLMTIDLAWFTRSIGVRDFLDREHAIQFYRQCLETHLKQRFEDREWQTMVDLGYAVIALRATCLFGHWHKFEENPDTREYILSLIKNRGKW